MLGPVPCDSPVMSDTRSESVRISSRKDILTLHEVDAPPLPDSTRNATEVDHVNLAHPLSSITRSDWKDKVEANLCWIYTRSDYVYYCCALADLPLSLHWRAVDIIQGSVWNHSGINVRSGAFRPRARDLMAHAPPTSPRCRGQAIFGVLRRHAQGA